mgnify:CR=1 FL=1
MNRLRLALAPLCARVRRAGAGGRIFTPFWGFNFGGDQATGVRV